MSNISAVFGPWIIAFYSALLLALGVLYRLHPEARKRIKFTLMLALLSIAGIVLTDLLGGLAAGGLVKVGVVLSRLIAVIAAINTAAVMVFSVALPRFGAVSSKFVEDLILAGAYIAAGLAVLSASGANLGGLLATSAVVTGVVAFSLQDTLGNVIGGTVLHLENSFQPGDWISVEGLEGVIREVRWRQTTLETLDGDLVMIPNITLMKGTVTVLGRAAGNTRYRAIPFNVYYDKAPGDVIAAVDEAFRHDLPPGVAATPKPYCGLKDFLPSCASYEVRYYLSDFNSPARVDSSVRLRVYYALSRAGVKLSVPVRSVVVSETAQNVAEKSNREEQRRRLEALGVVDVFSPLTDDERGLLALRLKPAPFPAGDIVTRQGAVADWLYIISEGHAEVRVSREGSEKFTVVKTLGPGDFFGEMGLLTGEPRTATVVAVGETRCYRLDRAGFADILERRPEIAGAIAELLAKRRVELSAAKQNLGGKDAVGLKAEQQNLLSKIRDFFKL